MIMRIKNLRLRTIIGVNDWERNNLQDVVINVEMEFDGARATETDSISDSVNYRTITKRIIAEVEKSHFHLLDKLASHILHVVLEDEKLRRATVEVDKPHALRFADSVSVSCFTERK